MTDAFDRPAARRRPRAAADETSDPMDTAAALPAATPAVIAKQAPASPTEPRATATTRPLQQPTVSAAPRPRIGAYVTLNVRVAPDIDELINRAMAEHGMTKRAAVEHALRHTYG
jgi:hypothetical protein